jgi:hypothetical protein
MVIDLNDEQRRSPADFPGLLDGTVMMDFALAAKERYAFIARPVKRFGNGWLRRTWRQQSASVLMKSGGYFSGLPRGGSMRS